MNKHETLIAVGEGRGCLGKAADDEPVFVLRAADRCAPAAIRDWANRAEAAGADGFGAKVAGARQVALDMEAWQAKNPSKTKFPD